MNNQQIGIIVFLIIVIVYLTIKLYLWKNNFNEENNKNLNNKKFIYPNNSNIRNDNYNVGDLAWDYISYQQVKIVQVKNHANLFCSYLIMIDGKPEWVQSERLWSLEQLNELKQEFENSLTNETPDWI